MPGSLKFPEKFIGGVIGKDFIVPINTRVLEFMVPLTKNGRYLVSEGHGRGVTTLFTAVCTASGLTLENFSDRVLNPEETNLTDDNKSSIRVLISTEHGREERVIEACGWRR